MSDETNERYWIEIGRDVVEIWDGAQEKAIAGYSGSDRLLAATAELNRLNDAAQDVPPSSGTWEPWTPAEFLSKKLPAVARRQRLEAHLAEVTEIEESLVRVLAEDAANLKRATALREKLEKELARPLSEPLAAQNAPEVVADTEIALGLLSASQAIAEQRADLFKSGPY